MRIIVEQKRTLGLSGLRPAMTLAKEQGNQSILKILQGAATRWVWLVMDTLIGTLWCSELLFFYLPVFGAQ